MSFCDGNLINLADKPDKMEVTSLTARPTADLDKQRESPISWLKDPVT